MRTHFALLVAIAIFFALALATAEEPKVGVWMSPGGPWGIWKKSYDDDFPVKMIVNDLAELGITDIWFFEQCGRGGGFLHPTKVQHARTEPRMKDRDFLKELLEETARHNIGVWLAWTPPEKEYPGTTIRGLNNPELIKIYTDVIDEVGKNYGQYKNLAGIMWHEVDCTEHPDNHEDDVAEFAEFCQRCFGEAYTGDKMPQVNAQDKWWRRFVLYKNHVVNTFVEKTARAAAKYGLKTHFCFYTPEAFSGESWRWGYDVVGLERLCDAQWFSGYTVESGKAYQTIKGAWIDFGISYKGQIVSRNYSYGFHGCPLSYFEYRSPVYLAEMRRYYSGIKNFTEKYGDIYTGYLGRTEKEMALFEGKENLKNWLRLMTWWQGGTSTASVAVAVNPIPFVMQHPESPGGEYDKKVRTLMEGLTGVTDVDAFVLGSQFSLNPQNLRRYSLIIIPEEMGIGLSKEMARVLREFVGLGGKLLVVSTPLRISKADLTEEADFTAELCGVRILKPGLSGYIRPESQIIALEDGKFWGAGIKLVEVLEGNILTKERSAGYPLLTCKGNAYFSALGSSPESGAYFRAVVRHIAQPPISLSDNTGIRILEGVRKGGLICVALWGRGKAKLHVDAQKMGLTADAYSVKDIVTGNLLGEFAATVLRSGVPVEIRHVHQPRVIAIGPKAELDVFKGIYPSEDVFAGMEPKTALESPEVPVEAGKKSEVHKPDSSAHTEKPQLPARTIEVGVLDYLKKYTETPSKTTCAKLTQACWKAVQQAGLNPVWVDVDIFLPSNKAQRDRFKRIVIPTATEWFTQKMYEGMYDYVKSGGLLITNCGLLLLDANSNYKVDEGDGITDFARHTFLGVRAHASATMRQIKALQECPLTKGLDTNTWLKLEPEMAGRDARNVSAEVVIVSDRIKKGEPAGEQPFLTYKHQQKGACIYLVGQIGESMDKNVAKIVQNMFSAETLEWLCLQE